MLIKAITHKIPDGWGRMGYQDILKGTYKGMDVTIERFGFVGQQPLEKHYTFSGKNFQKIINKFRKTPEEKFNRIG